MSDDPMAAVLTALARLEVGQAQLRTDLMDRLQHRMAMARRWRIDGGEAAATRAKYPALVRLPEGRAPRKRRPQKPSKD